jgi:ketosteroid isomerase-like protein
MGTNAELLRKGHAASIAAFKSGDPSNLLSLLDPAVEWQTGDPGVLESVYHGHEGVRRYLKEFLWESWEELQLDTEEVLEGEEGRVFAAARVRGRGKASGAPAEARLFEVVEIRNGLITKRRAFSNRESALKAAGLSERDVRAAP